MKKLFVLLPVASLLALAGCATVPTGPTVMVLPGSQKSFDQFQADGATCAQFAQAQVGDAAQAANNNAAANVVAATAVSAAVGAILGSVTGYAGQGAAIGAGTGLLFGSAAGANAAGMTYYDAQRRYDMAYAQCMFARGNQVPGRVAFRSPTQGYTVQNFPPPNMAAPNIPPANTPAPNIPPANTPAPNIPPPNTPAPSNMAPKSGYVPQSSPSPYGVQGAAPARIPAPATSAPGSAASPANYPPPNTPPPEGYGAGRG
jgi:hypothetical protein